MILVNKKKKRTRRPWDWTWHHRTPGCAAVSESIVIFATDVPSAGCYTMKAITVCLLNTDDSRKGSVTATGVGKCRTKSLFTSGDTSVKIYCSLKSVSQMIVRRTMNLFLELLIHLLVVLWSYLLKYLIFIFFICETLASQNDVYKYWLFQDGLFVCESLGMLPAWKPFK